MMLIMMLSKLITENKIGGLIFFQGGPVRQANLTNRYQSKSKNPVYWYRCRVGLSMRLDSTYTYPWNMTLGAVHSELKIRVLKWENKVATRSAI
jgi:hypothetical protein